MNKKGAFDLSLGKNPAGTALGKAFVQGAGRVTRGSLDGRGHRFAIVVSRFNLVVTQKLLLGAMEGLRRCGVLKSNIEIVWTPGAFEIPQAAMQIALAKRPVDAILCLGAVIRGETPHFEFIAREAARGILRVGIRTGIPAVFGVLTTHTLKQALARAGGKHSNKGWDAAMTAVEMANLFRQLRKS